MEEQSKNMNDLPPVPQEYSEQLAEDQVENQETAVENQATEVAPQESAEKVESDKEYNIRQLREGKERAERERDEMLQVFKEHVANNSQKNQPKEEEANYDPEDYVEAKYLNKQLKRLEEKLSTYQQTTQESSAELRLKAEYSDFSTVVTAENLKRLSSMHPEIAETLSYGKSLYAKGATAYKMIKSLGILPNQTATLNKQRADENAAKPRSMATLSPQKGSTPLSHANAFAGGLTDELKEQLRKEMVECIKYR